GRRRPAAGRPRRHGRDEPGRGGRQARARPGRRRHDRHSVRRRGMWLRTNVRPPCQVTHLAHASLATAHAGAREERQGLPMLSPVTLADLVGTDVDESVDADTSPPAAPAAGGLQLTGQQQAALDKIAAWYADRSKEAQVFRLFGYAGTGKTTIARRIVEQLGIRRVVYAAFTGKAAYVLRTRGCEGATTVHSLIYQPIEKVKEQLEKLRAQLRETTDPAERQRLSEEIQREQAKVDSPDWILREKTELDTA